MVGVQQVEKRVESREMREELVKRLIFDMNESRKPVCWSGNTEN